VLRSAGADAACERLSGEVADTLPRGPLVGRIPLLRRESCRDGLGLPSSLASQATNVSQPPAQHTKVTAWQRPGAPRRRRVSHRQSVPSGGPAPPAQRLLCRGRQRRICHFLGSGTATNNRHEIPAAQNWVKAGACGNDGLTEQLDWASSMALSTRSLIVSTALLFRRDGGDVPASGRGKKEWGVKPTTSVRSWAACPLWPSRRFAFPGQPRRAGAAKQTPTGDNRAAAPM
jgi:hypothetical protein